ncbi:helix-turn-helix domain-containing protein [Actinokineospora bangkokensis]|uniref:HTH cro/C1-type domain-containing protein n=1 Tax=Actinokineospora bangkokensis TaxID=1193682 RepID=A0A1Q9LKP8_9PSEU|nr:helix-turn-helix transcriptional regulator [Actinokineospora bangkokensis]OLR92598.1 hypothetical protein BJP25_21345 [Actinokineospora bangkokensis]
MNHPAHPGHDTAAPSTHMINRAVGEQLRRTREAAGLSREQLAATLPYPLHPQSLGAYEGGHRALTVFRFIDLGRGCGASAPDVLAGAMQLGGIDLHLLVLRVDLGAIQAGPPDGLDLLSGWALNRIRRGDGIRIVTLTPAAVEEIAAFCDRTPTQMARILARYSPVPSTDIERAPR